MSEHPNDVHMEESAESAESSELSVSNVEKLNMTDDAKSGTCSDDETGSTVTIGEIGVDEYFDDTFCDDSVVDTTDYREATAAAAANLLPVLINIIGNGNNATVAAAAEYQDKLTDIIRSAHTMIARPADSEPLASTSTPRSPRKRNLVIA